MMNSAELTEHIRQFCRENENPANIEKYKRYFKEAPDSYGLTQPQVNEKSKQLLRDKAFSLETLLDAMPGLLKGKYEETTIGLLLFNGFDKLYTRELFEKTNEWFRYSIHNWAHADTMGMFILPKFFSRKVITDSNLATWITSPYKFQRRCVPVTFIKTLKARDSFGSLFQLTEPLITDPEREVHQGMGWFLRECWKYKATETEEFLRKWKDHAPRLIIQYATEKMSSEQKQEYKKEKASLRGK